MQKQNLIIIGSTGSVGVNALNLVQQYANKFNIVALINHSNYGLFAKQINSFNPQFAVLVQPNNLNLLQKNVNSKSTTILSGKQQALQVINNASSCTTVLIASSTTQSIEYLITAMQKNLKIAIANKESIVCGGSFLQQQINNYSNKIIPLDSEHSAIFQTLQGSSMQDVSKILLTASGGPFLHYTPQQMQNITLQNALKHPVWSMGAKISIDSATLMNKALEVIEASYLFNIPYNQIEVLVHPQALLHGGVFYKDSSFIGHFANPNMQLPIAYALFYPKRVANQTKPLNLIDFASMEFLQLDNKKFKAIDLAKNVLKLGNNYPCAFNASNEIAVQSYLNNKINFVNIVDVVEYTLNKINNKKLNSVEEILQEYNLCSNIALNYINSINK